MKVDIKDLLGSVRAIQSPNVRIGLPDDPTIVDIADIQRFTVCLENALCAFRGLCGGADYLVSAEVNTYHRAVWIRFVQRGSSRHGDGQVEAAIERVFQSLLAAAMESGGDLSYWGGNNYFDVSLPFRRFFRDDFPDVKHKKWDDRYSYLLRRASWGYLRQTVFRFSHLAESIAARCIDSQLSRVLIPSVGLCVHPWLFANHGLFAIATDAAKSALDAVSEPESWPELYSPAAFERWDISESASYASHGNPDHFQQMPDLDDPGIRELLRQRVRFVVSDWAKVPLDSGSIDAIFATNALPRDSSGDQLQVLNEWIRLVRPGGLVFIAQHNFFDSDIEPMLRNAGWVEANILNGMHPAKSGVTAFQIRYSSG